jgi:tetratricopeptide (TPR) repeat protein/CHAT domain-containing protein
MTSAFKKYSIPLAIILLLTFQSRAAAQANTDNADIEQFALELVTTKNETERNLLLAARKDLVTADLRKELVKHGNLVLAAGEYSSALSIYTMVQDISKRIADTEGSATASLNIGTVNYFQGRYAEAVDHYRSARRLFVNAGNKIEAAKALFGLGLALQEERDTDGALEAFELAHKEFVALNDKEESSNSLTAIGSLHYARGEYAAASKAFLESAGENSSSENLLHVADAFYMQGEYLQALGYYERALKEREVAPASIVSALGSAANSYYYLGNYERALESYQKALAINERLGDKLGAATQLQGLGNTYRSLGDFGAALDSYIKSLVLSEEQASSKLSGAQTLGSIGLVRALQGQNSQALELFQKSLTQFDASGDKVGMARMLSLIGNVQFIQANYQQALDAYQKSLALREAMGDKTNSAHNLTGIGATYLALGNATAAVESYDRSLALLAAAGNQAAIANVLTKIAEAHLSTSNYQQALTASQRAVELAKQNESFNVQWYAMLESARAQRLLGRVDEARATLLEAISVVDSLRSQPAIGEPGSERSGVGPFLALLELEIDQNKAAEAFQLAERAKLVALREMLNRTRTRLTKGMTPDEQAKETSLTSKLVSSFIQLERQEDQGRATEASLQKLRAERRAARSDFDAFVAKLNATHPDVKVNRGEIAPVGFAEAGALLTGDNDALVEFVVTDTNSYLFVLTDQRTAAERRRKTSESPLVLKAYPLNINAKELAERVARFRESLIARDEAVREPARELYDLLLKPAEEQLNGKTVLTIVPDGVLWEVPFEALQPADDQYLIDSKTISYAPSVSALREIRKRADRQSRGGPTLLAIGNPSVSKEVMDRLRLTYSIELGASTDSTLQKMKTIGDVASGPAATEDRLKAELGRRGLIHFEAPLILDDLSPMYSTLVLSSGKTNGLFQVANLLQLNAAARIAVLAETETFNRSTAQGNAQIATSWAWFVAGTPTLVLGRWRVESGGSEQLMVELHRKLKAKPRNSAAALRDSALTLRRSSEYHHPFYWSGFSVLGDAR